jgi:hypothetical protein
MIMIFVVVILGWKKCNWDYINQAMKRISETLMELPTNMGIFSAMFTQILSKNYIRFRYF